MNARDDAYLLWNESTSPSRCRRPGQRDSFFAGWDAAMRHQEPVRAALVAACATASDIILLSDKSTNAGSAAFGAAHTIKERLLPALALALDAANKP